MPFLCAVCSLVSGFKSHYIFYYVKLSGKCQVDMKKPKDIYSMLKKKLMIKKALLGLYFKFILN